LITGRTRLPFSEAGVFAKTEHARNREEMISPEEARLSVREKCEL